MMAQSPLTISAIRRLAKRRGYTVRKLRNQDRYYLRNHGRYDSPTDIAETVLNEDGSYFTKYELEQFLKGMDTL